MGFKRKLFTPVDLALLAAIIVLVLGGVAYAIFSGVVKVAGLTPVGADVPSAQASPVTRKVTPSPVVSPSVVPSPTPTSTPSPTPSASPSVAASPSPSAVATPSPTLTPTPTPVPSPSPSPSPDPKAAMKERDLVRKEKDLPTIQAALKLYKDKYKKYPISAAYTTGRTDSATTPLKVLVDEGYLKELPVDVMKAQDYWYGYKTSADGKTFELTAHLEDTTDPAGAYNDEKPPKYLYTVRNP